MSDIVAIPKVEDLSTTRFNEKIMVQLLMFVDEFKRYPGKDELTIFNAFPDISIEHIPDAIKETFNKAKANHFVLHDPITQEIFLTQQAKNYLKPYH